MDDPLIFEHPDVPFGEVWWRPRYRVALVNPQHHGIVYVNGNIIGSHECAICDCCGMERPDHRVWCACLASA